MKKIYAIFGLALAMLTAGCAKDATNDVMPGKVTIGVGIEQTRTSLGALNGNKHDVLWSAGDKIAVNGVASDALATQYEGLATATFTVSNVAAPYSILYPAEILGADGNITVPTEQAYTPNSFACGSAVLVGYTESTSATLHNLYSFVKITIAKGDDVALKSVTLTALGGEAISGTFAVDYKAAAIAPLAGKDVIRVSAAEGIPYVDGKASVVIAVPAGAYAGGFSVKVVDATGKAMVKKAYTAQGIEVPAGVLLNMPEFTYVGAEQAITSVTNAAELQAALAQFQLEVVPETLPHIVLDADIDLTGVELVSAADFYGVFDGQGYAIKNWNTSRALFIVNHGTVKNVVIDESCTLTAAYDTSGDKNVGFVVEDNEEPGIVAGCVNNGKVIVNDLSCAGHRIGGVVGTSYGTVHDCINNGDIEVTSAAVNNNHNIGGVVGYCNPNAGSKEALGTAFLANCINNGNVTVVFPCLPKKAMVGGVLGGTQNAASTTAAHLGTIKNCINNGDVKYRFEVLSSGTYGNVGGVVGYAQVDLIDCNNYGRVEYSTPTDPSAAGTRAAAGGVVGCNLFSVENCNNYGELFCEGVWAAGTNDAAAAGSQAGSSFGGVAGCVGVYNKLSEDYPTVGCNNYGKVNLNIACKTGGGTAGYFGGVVGFTTNDISDCHNYEEVNISTFLANTYMAGVVGYSQYGDADNLSNNGPVNLVGKGITSTGKTFYLAGVIGRAVNITNCVNNGATTHTVNPCDIAVSTIYSGAVAGYADVKVENCTLNAAYSLTTADNLASLRCAGIAGQVKTGSAPMYTAVNCNTTEKASITLSTKNTKANYIGGILGSCNNGLQGCTNKASITVNTLEPNTGTAIYYVAGISGNQKETLLDCHNEGNITVDHGNSTCPIYAGTLVGKNHTSACIVKDCTNSGNLTIINTASTDQKIGVLGGDNPADDTGAVTYENCTNTGVVTVNGVELGAAPALSVDGKRWQLPADIAAEITGVATAVVVADLGVTTPGMLYIAVDYESVYGAQAAGMWAPMVQATYTVEATDATSGNIVLATTDHFGDTVKTNVPYSNLTEESVTIDCTNMIGMPGNGPCTIYTGEVNLNGGGVAM